MKASDVHRAAIAAGVPDRRLCDALADVLPVLRHLRDNASWLKPWIKIGLGVAIGALEAYQRIVCPRITGWWKEADA